LEAFEDSTNRMRLLIARLREREPESHSDTHPCDLVALFENLLATSRVGQRPGCTVRVLAPDGARPCLVDADRAAVGQVFSNLVVNAVESLRTEDGEVTIAIQPEGTAWRVEVRDNGVGIPAEFQTTHLFRPFRTTKDGGLGIGLYQSKTLVEAAGGRIAVSSAENHGTVVTVTLPAAGDGSYLRSGETEDGQAERSGR